MTAPCAYKLGANWTHVGFVFGEWMAKSMHGRGQVILDRGLPGEAISADALNGIYSAFKNFPGIKVVGYYFSQFAMGPEESGVATLLTAHPNVGGIDASYGAGALRAVLAAAKSPSSVAITGSAYNVSNLLCAETKGSQCLNISNAPTLAADGMNLALEVLEGKTVPRQQYTMTPFYYNNNVTVPGNLFVKIQLGVSALPNEPPGLFLPYKPSFMPQLTLQDALGKGV